MELKGSETSYAVQIVNIKKNYKYSFFKKYFFFSK